MPVTFQVVVNLADYGNHNRDGIVVAAVAEPEFKVGDVAIHSNESEQYGQDATTDVDGLATLTLVSLPGLWYTISTPFARAMPPVTLAGYIPDVDDPTTGVAFPADTVINLKHVVSEDPTPGYEAIIVYPGGGGGGAVDSVNGETGVVVLDAADVGADPAGTAATLVGALTIPDSPDDIGAATAAQGALADTAVQPADLTAYATDAELAVGLGTKANTSHGHAIADTTGLQAALGAKADDLGADDNYVTDAEKVKLSNLSGTNTGDQVLPTWSTISGKPAVVAAGATQADARTAIGAGTSSLVVGTGAGDAKAGNYQPTAANVSDSTTTGRALLTAVDAAAARTTLGLGTAATTAATAYATAAQGAKADSALQPSTAQAINAQTGTSYTLVAADAGKVVTLSNAAAITLNAPGSVFTAGQRIDVIVIGAGMATVVGTSGATANPPADRSLVSRVQYSAFTILWTSATACVVIGDLA